MKKVYYELSFRMGGFMSGPTTRTAPVGVLPMQTTRVAPPSDSNFMNSQELGKAVGAIAMANPSKTVFCEWSEDGNVSAWLV